MLKDAILAMYPGLDKMYKDMKFRARTNQPIKTWGGRVYYCEPPRIVDNRIKVFDYKMVNVLIQGSAADCTKEAMIRFYNQPAQASHAERAVEKMNAQIQTLCKQRGWHMILQVHDEIVLSVPAKDVAMAQAALKAAMESVEFDVQILSEGAYSANNWAVMADFDKKGVIVANDYLPKGKRKNAA
jgi:DNA polymerase I-like protein with 3'-5' exonuclease and polymerase domains